MVFDTLPPNRSDHYYCVSYRVQLLELGRPGAGVGVRPPPFSQPDFFEIPGKITGSLFEFQIISYRIAGYRLRVFMFLE